MTRQEVLQRTVERCDALMAEGLEAAEIFLVDLGADAQDLENALGPQGFWRKILEQDRDQQIDMVARWLRGERSDELLN
jgi:hypothetical protein